MTIKIKKYVLQIKKKNIQNFEKTVLTDGSLKTGVRTGLLNNLKALKETGLVKDEKCVFSFLQDPHARLKKITTDRINFLSIPVKYRNIILGNHLNIDVISCHPNIILNILRLREASIDFNFLSMYVKDRNRLCNDFNLSKKDLKIAIFKPLYGGSLKNLKGELLKIAQQIQNIMV